MLSFQKDSKFPKKNGLFLLISTDRTPHVVQIMTINKPGLNKQFQDLKEWNMHKSTWI